ncbi:MAG: arginine deiminase family protein [Chitinispirillaceae bacterium]
MSIFSHAAAALNIPYGCDTFGKLDCVMVHTPGEELKLITPENRRRWLFAEAPDFQRFRDEHIRYQTLLKVHGVNVLELSDYVSVNQDLISTLPNLTFIHDAAVISSKGAILSSMASAARKDETLVVREALEKLGIPLLVEFDDYRDAFEGCILLSPETILVFGTDRHKYASVYTFIRMALEYFDDILFVNVPQKNNFNHPDTIFNRISPTLALAYLPAFKDAFQFRRGVVREIDFAKHMMDIGIELVPISESEQRRDGCSFVSLESGLIIHEDGALDKQTRHCLSRKGVEFIFHNNRHLKAGFGNVSSHTLQVKRENYCSLDW